MSSLVKPLVASVRTFFPWPTIIHILFPPPPPPALPLPLFPPPSSQVSSLVKPVASVKKLSITLRLQPDVPEMARGDDRRLLQAALNVVGGTC